MEQRSNKLSERNRTIDISESLGKIPPQAQDLETAILGAILLEKHAIKNVGKLKPDHFYNNQHQEIFEACLELQKRNDPIDMRTVVAELRQRGKLEIVGGAYYIAELTSKVSSAANVAYHCKIIMEMAMKRNLIQIASQIHHDAYEDTTDIFDLLEKVDDALFQLKQTKGSLNNVIDHNSAASIIEFKNGKPVGEKAGVSDMAEIFSWKRTFMNCWTGWPNDGKTTFFQFMATVKSKMDENWKWCIWSPEMISSRKNESGKIEITATDIEDEIIFTLTGKNPYLHYAKRYNIPQMSLEEYMEAAKWVNEHFIFINPSERKYTDLLDNFKFVFETKGVSGFLIDPYKNLDQQEEGRTDLYLDKVFSDCKKFAIDTNSSFNFIAHPRNQIEPKNTDGSFKICTQYMLAGGAAWNNNMDGIYSVYRPFSHKNPTDPKVWFYTLKQRKQNLVGRRGVCRGIEFDFLKNRYFFGKVDEKGDDIEAKVCPIDGSFKNPTQSTIFEQKTITDKNKLHQISVVEFKPDDHIEAKKSDDDDLPF